MRIADLRASYHREICERIVRTKTGSDGKTTYPNFADGGMRSSVQIAWGIVNRLTYARGTDIVPGQGAGGRFEEITLLFLQNAFGQLQHLRPGAWHYSVQDSISGFDQYRHLRELEELVRNNSELASALGGDYIFRPDIVISRSPVSDVEINRHTELIDADSPLVRYSPLREANSEGQALPILHASVSCKWTLRSDRGQSARTEMLNLIRNRKGHLPHIVAVTAEPLPSRIASLALGTGDLDCVYHFALPELIDAVSSIDNPDQLEMLNTMVDGRRLRDISDLPFDLAI